MKVFLKHKELSNARVVSITKKEYGFALHFYKDSSDERLNAIC